MKNPITGLEENTDALNTKQTTVSSGWPAINLDVMNQYRQALWTWPALEHTTTTQTPTSTVSNVSGGLSNLKTVAPITAQVKPIVSNVTTQGAMTGLPAPTTGWLPVPPITGWANTTPITTNINEQKALTQNELDRQKAVKDAQQSYILNKSQYDTNKAYYQNYDTVNDQFNNIMKDREALLTGSPDGQISDAQAQQIASKYGVSADAVKNPNKIFEALTPTEEGKQKLGITGHEQQMSDAELANTRAKEDAATNLAISTQNIENNIADVQKQLTRNLEFATASGAWSGGLKSSGYLAGIENIRSDGQTTIARLQNMLQQVKSADAKNVWRLTQDYNTAVTRAKTDFDSQLKDLQHNTGLNLNEATSKYGIGTEEFSKQLDKINAQYGMYSADISAKYIANMKAVNGLTTQNIENTKKMTEYQDAITNKRYSEYIDPKNPLIANTSYSGIAQDVNSGKLSYEQGQVLKNSMVTSINATLSKNGVVSADDTNTITHMLEAGKTPSQVVAQMQTLPKFAPKATIEKTLDLGDRIRVQYSDGKTEDIQKGTEGMSEAQKQANQIAMERINLDREKEWLPPIGWENVGAGVNTTGSDLYKKMTASTNPIGVYATGDMSGDRHAQIYNTAQELGLNTFINKFNGTKITADMVNESAQKYGIDPLMIAATMALDSSMGTAGKGARNNNPGNVGQFDSLDAKGITVKWYNTLQDGIDAVANNLAKRQKALGLWAGKPQTVESTAKEYTATQHALFDKILAGKDTEADQKSLRRQWLTDADVNAYAANKPKTTELSDDQRAIYNSQLSGFRGNQIVKDYEQQIGQVSNIVSSLNSNSWPGDIASVFSFMKALDPSSTVREGEFALAAKSSGLVGSFTNMLSKLENGEMLTDEQKKQFGELSKSYLQNKSKQYDRLYDDMARVTKLSWVPNEYLPRRASDDISVLLRKPTPEQITKATPKVLEDIKAGKSLEEMKQHAKDKGFDPAFVEKIYNENKTGTTTETPAQTGNIMDRIKALRNQ